MHLAASDVLKSVTPCTNKTSYRNQDVHKKNASLRSIISGLSVEEAHRVVKAFAIYFELTNLAETTHRKRRRRAAKLHPEQPALEGSFRAP